MGSRADELDNRPPVVSEVLWTGWDGTGREHCRLTETERLKLLEGLIVGGAPALIGVYYRVRTDALWRTRDVLLSHGGGPRVHLVSDGAGNWSDAQSGDDLPALAGCLDVDIGLTPATNTLPIRRLDLAQGETAVLRVVFLPPHTSDPGPRVMAQSYTCQKPGTKYRYHGVDSDFTADLEVDARGLVLDYPETFRRLD